MFKNRIFIRITIFIFLLIFPPADFFLIYALLISLLTGEAIFKEFSKLFVLLFLVLLSDFKSLYEDNKLLNNLFSVSLLLLFNIKSFLFLFGEKLLISKFSSV